MDGVRRPASNSNERSTPALGDAQARRLLEAPGPDTLKGVRDRAILATLLYRELRWEKVCLLRLRDIQSRRGIIHFVVRGKGSKERYVPVHPMALWLIDIGAHRDFCSDGATSSGTSRLQHAPQHH